MDRNRRQIVAFNTKSSATDELKTKNTKVHPMPKAIQ